MKGLEVLCPRSKTELFGSLEFSLQPWKWRITLFLRNIMQNLVK